MSEEARLAAVMEVRLDRIDEKLSDFNRKIANSMRKASKDMDVANDNWSKIFGKKPNFAKALDGVIDNTRLKILDSGVARIGLFGSALENLGPAGLIAAAGVGAFAAAMVQTRAAAAFADEIGDTANRLHVTTDALQEYRYAIRLAGGEEKGADEALESFSATLGKAQAGLPKAQKAFKELGFSKAQIDSFKTVEDGLVAVTGRIEKLGSNVQKDAVIDQLGLNGLKPLIEEGVAEMQRLKAEAQSIGVVMDAGLIAKGGEANDKFETLEKIISIQLKSAFVDLAPVLTSLLGLAADLAREFADVAAIFQSVESRSLTALKDKRDQLSKSIAADNQVGFLPGAKELAAHKQGKLDKINAAIAAKEAASAASAPGVPQGNSLIDVDAGAKAAADRAKALQRAASSQALIDDATRNELQARRALVHDLFEQAVLAAQELDAEAARRSNRIAADLAQGKITDAAAATATALNRRATDEQKAGVAAELTTKLEQDRLAKHRELASILDSTTSIYASLARTVEERRKLELKLLQKQHEDRIGELSVRRDQAAREGRDGDVKDISRLIGAENENYGAARKQVAQQNQGPLAAYFDTLPRTLAELNDQAQALAVQGLGDLNRGLADAIVNSKSLGDVATSVFKQMATRVVQSLLESSEQGAGSLLHLPGFAGGGYTGAGAANQPAGLAHKGEVIFDQPAVSRLGVPFLEALRRGKIPGYRQGGLVGLQALALPSVASLGRSARSDVYVDARGAMIWEGEMQRIKSFATGEAQRFAAAGRDGAIATAYRQAPGAVAQDAWGKR